MPECLLKEIYSTRTRVAFWLTLSCNETACTSQLVFLWGSLTAFHKYKVFMTWMNGQSKIDTSIIRILSTQFQSFEKLHDPPWFPTLWSDRGHPYLGKWVLHYRKTIDKRLIKCESREAEKNYYNSMPQTSMVNLITALNNPSPLFSYTVVLLQARVTLKLQFPATKTRFPL